MAGEGGMTKRERGAVCRKREEHGREEKGLRGRGRKGYGGEGKTGRRTRRGDCESAAAGRKQDGDEKNM